MTDDPAIRIAELEATLKQRDDKIKELINERDKALELVDQMREHLSDNEAVFQQWIETFEMQQCRDVAVRCRPVGAVGCARGTV